MRRIPMPMCISGLVLLFAGVAFGGETVSQSGNQFTPSAIAVPQGGTVTFLNEDQMGHNIVIKGPGMNFDSGLQPVGKKIEVTFDRTGTYDVRCVIHPRMKATVTVSN